MTEKPSEKLHKAVSATSYVTNPHSLVQVPIMGNADFMDRINPLSQPFLLLTPPVTYEQELFQCRYFYRRDPFASTVINRMSEMSAGRIQNHKNYCTEEEYSYFLGLAPRLDQFIADAALEYFVAGMAVPDFFTTKIMGNRLHPKLGRKRYSIPDPIWVRNTDTIQLERSPVGAERLVYIRLSSSEINFILSGGQKPDGTFDKELYNSIVKQFPEYVAAIREGKTRLSMPNIKPILRKPMVNCDYPQPFLVPSLDSLKHKMRIKEMDYTIATRAIEAILLIQAGSDEFPVTEDDDTFENLKGQLSAQDLDARKQLIYKLFTNHTIKMSWVHPPFEALLSADKYIAVDADIFMSVGFSRVLLTGETLRSNASTGDTIILGPLATLQEARSCILRWIKYLYEKLADANGFDNIPEPSLPPLSMADAKTLLQYASNALKDGAISRNLYAQLFGSDYNIEALQREFEEADSGPVPSLAPKVTNNGSNS